MQLSRIYFKPEPTKSMLENYQIEYAKTLSIQEKTPRIWLHLASLKKRIERLQERLKDGDQ